MIKLGPAFLRRLLSKLRHLCRPENQHSKPFSKFLRQYGIALGSVALATGIKIAIAPFMEMETPFLLYFAAIMVSAWYGGRAPGIGAAILAALTSDYLFLSPLYSFVDKPPGQTLRLILFFLEGSAMAVSVSSLQKEKKQSIQSARAVQQHLESFLQSEERFRLLVEGVEDYALYMLDPQGRVSSWNPGAKRLKGWLFRLFGDKFF